MPLEPESDLHWTAFLYVAGDLTADESSNFERLLSEDQAAREAVLEAVELAQALAIVGSETLVLPARRKHSVFRKLAWAGSLAAAAGLLASVVTHFQSVETTQTLAVSDASSVALAWSDLRVGPDPEWTAFVDDGQGPDAPASAPIDEPGAENLEEESGTSADRALPSWLLSAASVPVPSAESPSKEN